jgi:hypothetical protein
MMPSPIPVLIAGGGPVELALAGDLGWRIRCLLIKHRRPGSRASHAWLADGRSTCSAAPSRSSAWEPMRPMQRH